MMAGDLDGISLFGHENYTVIAFESSWLDQQGLPTNMGRWVRANMRPDQTCVGVRWIDQRPHAFSIHRGEKTSTDDRSHIWKAQFELVNGNVMSVSEGEMEIKDKRTHRLLKQWVRYVSFGGDNSEEHSTWKLVREVSMIDHRTHDRCPATVLQAWSEIDYMVMKLTGVRRERMSIQLSGGFIGRNHVADNTGVKLSPDWLVKLYDYVAENFHSYPHRPKPTKWLFDNLLEDAKRIYNGEEPQFRAKNTEVSSSTTAPQQF